jgi:hypothetical protein
LLAAVGSELFDEQWRQGEDELGLALAWFDAFAAGEVPAAAGTLRAFAAVAPAARRAWPLYFRAPVAAGGAVVRAAGLVSVSGAVARAGAPVAAGGAFGRVAASVTEAGPLELPADFDRAFV